jgi:hypothetical protein
MSNPTPLDIYEAFWTKLQTAPSFKTKSETWNNYANDITRGRPALYLTVLNTQVSNSIDGLPELITLDFEIHCRTDRKARPNVAGIRLIAPLEEEIKTLFARSPVTGFQTLGFSRGWVMHCQWQGTEYFYDLIQDNDVAEWIMSYRTFCAPNIGSG